MIQKAVLDGELTGFSVGALPEKDYEDLKRTLPIQKAMFNDVDEGKWFALTISLVDIPFYPEMVFKVFDETDIIKKELTKPTEDITMSKDESGVIAMFNKFMDYVIKKETAVEPEPVTEPTFVTEEQMNAKFDEIKDLINGLKPEEEEDPEDKDGDTEPDTKDVKAGAKPEDETPEDPEDPEDPDPEDDEVITKAIPQDQRNVKSKSFMGQLGRDSHGYKIIKQ